jgi:hypothetical protein
MVPAQRLVDRRHRRRHPARARQLAMDATRAPTRMITPHPTDLGLQVGVDLRR